MRHRITIKFRLRFSNNASYLGLATPVLVRKRRVTVRQETAAMTHVLIRRLANGMIGAVLLAPRLLGEAVKEGEVGGELTEAVGGDEQANDDQQHATANLDFAKVVLEGIEKAIKLADAQGCEQKGNAKTRGVGGEERNALPDRVLRTGDRQNACQDRPDTGRPAKGESATDNEGPQDAQRLLRYMHALFTVQGFDGNEPCHVDSKKNQQHARHLAQKRQILEKRRTDGGCGCPQRDEDDRKTQNERDRIEQHRSPLRCPQGRFARTHGGHVDTRHERQIARHKRQHARREK